MSKKAKKENRKLSPYFCHGVDLSRKEGKNRVGDCPFCSKENHFSVDPDSGQYICAVCGERGNIVTFLEHMMKEYEAQVTDADLRALAKHRDLPVEAFKDSGWPLGFDGSEWMIGVRSKTGRLCDIRRYNPLTKVMRSTAGCSPELLGLDEAFDPKRAKETVYVNEGEWDGFATKWLLRRTGTEGVVTAVPGAAIFKNEWLPIFNGRRVRLCYDNDQAGDDGAERAAKALVGIPRPLEFLCWPESLPDGWDVRDCIKSGIRGRKHPSFILETIEGLFKRAHRRANSGASGGTDLAPGEASPYDEELPPEKCPSWEDVLEAFKSRLEMDEDNTIALAICLAVCLSSQAPGEPIWVHLVGPPGSGKTVILNQFQQSPKVVFRSTLTPHGLVSGFKTDPDPSLLPKLDGKTAIFKDFTEVLCFHVVAKDETFSTFRGAYDGYVQKDFGNGVQRHYKLKFNMLTGVTPAIHADSKATMGERFLKFNMMPTQKDADSLVMVAIGNSLGEVTEESKVENYLQPIVAKYLQRKIDFTKLPPIAMAQRVQIASVAQLCGMLRALVEREAYGDREIKYRPQYEVGTRVAKQLVKLAQFIAVVLGRKEVDPYVFKIAERVALDSCIGLNVEVIAAIMERGGRALGADLRERLGLPDTNIGRKVRDMQALGIIFRAGFVRVGANGNKADVFEVSPKLRQLWAAIRPDQSVIERAIKNEKSRRRKVEPEPPKSGPKEGLYWRRRAAQDSGSSEGETPSQNPKTRTPSRNPKMSRKRKPSAEEDGS